MVVLQHCLCPSASAWGLENQFRTPADRTSLMLAGSWAIAMLKVLNKVVVQVDKQSPAASVKHADSTM